MCLANHCDSRKTAYKKRNYLIVGVYYGIRIELLGSTVIEDHPLS